MKPIDTLTAGDAKPYRGALPQLILYLVLPSLPLLLFFLMWRIALAHTAIVLASAVSPDGAYTAEEIRRDPGGEASYEYYVRLRSTGSRIVDPLLGNEYRAFTHDGAVGQVCLQWAGGSRLTISCLRCTGCKSGESSWRRVQLQYIIKCAGK